MNPRKYFRATKQSCYSNHQSIDPFYLTCFGLSLHGLINDDLKKNQLSRLLEVPNNDLYKVLENEILKKNMTPVTITQWKILLKVISGLNLKTPRSKKCQPRK